MIALEVTALKLFMKELLSGEVFDHFLMSEITLTTAYTYTIDGHKNKEFFTQEEWQELQERHSTLATWADMKPLIFQLIKGSKTPLYMKLILQLTQENTAKLLSSNNCDVPADQVKALLLTIRFDGSKVVLTTGTSFTTFLMTKEPDEIWDKAIKLFLAKKEIPFEEV